MQENFASIDKILEYFTKRFLDSGITFDNFCTKKKKRRRQVALWYKFDIFVIFYGRIYAFKLLTNSNAYFIVNDIC